MSILWSKAYEPYAIKSNMELMSCESSNDMNALFNRVCVNYEGKVYHRFEASSVVDVDDARLEYFSKKVFPKIKDSLEGGTMIFTSSYFEFVRIRNFLKYTKQSDVSRSRLWFFEGRRKIMLYTERAHFYHRYKIRGIKNLVIYSLPERKEFYTEMVNMLEGSNSMSCSVLFSRFDLYRLERIVGTASVTRMSSSDKATFVFC
ncbi:hypothetical protein HPP92_003076 [Vanilla planifolia]|uniref:UTP25 C-terminal domain-containing protein n=1 Tax=Vanilla planifolia TaxID=51239 RepID=A0A835VIL5_VANPL|nr:hypothetical protein HPP92_003076 [Vanilla planifolia]